MDRKLRTSLVFFTTLIVLTLQNNQAQDVLSPVDLLKLKSCRDIQLSPDGSQILYSLSTPRGPNESPGKSNSTYWKMTLSDGYARPIFDKETKGSSSRWSPDGKTIGFLYKKEKGFTQVWAMPAGGGGSAAGADAQLQEQLDQLESEGPWDTADTMGFDEVIDPRELRNALLSGLELASRRRTRRLAPTVTRGIRP